MGLVRMVRPWNEWLIVWGYDINEPAARGRRGGRHARRAQPRRRRHDRRHAALDLALGQQQDVRRALRRGPRVLHGRRLPPAPAEQRPRLEHLDRRRLQPRAGSSRWSCGARPRRRCWTPTTPSARRSASRSCCARTRASRSSGRSSRRSACSTRATPTRCGRTWRPARRTRRRRAERAAKLRARDRAQELRVQRARRRARAALPLGAVVADGTPEPEYTRDPELYYHPTTWPGARLPHAGSSTTGARVSHARPGRQGPLRAADRHRRRGVGRGARERGDASAPAWRSRAYVIGPGRDAHDIYDDWARAREVEETGCVLVRPDAHVGWRSKALPADPAASLGEAMAQILGRA